MIITIYIKEKYLTAINISVSYKQYKLFLIIQLKMSRVSEPSYADDAYMLCVMAEDTSKGVHQDDQSLSIDHLEVSITWNVKRKYYSCTDLNKRLPIEERDELHVHDGTCIPSELDCSLPKLIGSSFFDHIIYEKTLFPSVLGDQMHWIERASVGTADGVRSTLVVGPVDMFHKLWDFLNAMVLSGRKKLGILVTVDKQITLSQEQYEAMARSTVEGDT